MPVPDIKRADEIMQNVVDSWRAVRRPDDSDIVIADPPDSEIIRSYFSGRQAEDVDLWNGQIAQEHPFDYFTPNASRYFIQAYLLYALDIRKFLDQVVPRCCDTPLIVLVSCLAKKNAPSKNPEFTLAQICCIVDFLGFVRSHLDFYCYKDESKYIDRGIASWVAAKSSRADSPPRTPQ